MIGTLTIKTVEKNLEEDLAQELRDQGHYLTGALEASINSTTSEKANSIILDVEALDYVTDLDTGIPGEHIDLNDQSYIAGLTRYAQLRFGYTGKTARRAAILIARKHRKEGMPTKASYQYSKTGERTQVIEESYDERHYDSIVENGFSKELDQLIDKTFDITIF